MVQKLWKACFDDFMFALYRYGTNCSMTSGTISLTIILKLCAISLPPNPRKAIFSDQPGQKVIRFSVNLTEVPHTQVSYICCKFWGKQLLPIKASKEIDSAQKRGILSMFCFPPPVQCSNLSFGIQKPSYVTNIQWKCYDFIPSGSEVIKVL